MKQMRDESGQAVILVALCLTCILGFVGFATDVGVLLHAKRNLQIAADAAAIAGAKEVNIDPTQIVRAGKTASAQNGITDGSNGASVVIHPTPVYGPDAGKTGYVEAIVTQTQPTFFMRVLSFSSMPVTARAVAFNGSTSGTGCLNAMDPTGADTIHLEGSFTLTAGCAVKDNSNNPSALDFTGGAGTLTAGSVGVVGGATGHTGDSTPAPITGIPQFSDPLYNKVTAPTYSGCAAPPKGSTWGPATSGGIVCYSGNIKVKNDVTMNPGVYVITGTLDLSGHGSLTGTGVTIYIAPGGTLGGGGNGKTTLNLTAPTSGQYSGILIYQDASNTDTISLNGTPIAKLTGIIYAPSAELDLSGNTDMNLTTDLIVGSLYDSGNAAITITDYTSQKSSNSPLTTIALVE